MERKGIADAKRLIPQKNLNHIIVSESENIQTGVIIITKDKLENILLKFFSGYKTKYAWKALFPIFMSTLTTVLTADFKDWLFKKEIWNAIYVIIMIVSGILTFSSFICARKHSKDFTVDFLINTIANDNER